MQTKPLLETRPYRVWSRPNLDAIPAAKLAGTVSTVAGLRYERKVVKALTNSGCDIDHNPWYCYDGDRYCCPDIVLYYLALDTAIIIEVKLTYTPEALKKLREVYVPVVSATIRQNKVYPLVIVKNLAPGMLSHTNLKEALGSPWPIIQWRGTGRIV